MDIPKKVNEKDQSKLIISNNQLKKIKSNCILKIFFGYLFKRKSLEIIKYNKNIQKRINVDINNYKEYSEKYSSIEIEIIPKKNKYRRFINLDEEDKKYYHIYFNDNKKEEIKRTILNKNDKITKINIIIDYQVTSFYGLFNCCICIESINFKKFYRNNITNMNAMFLKCSSLKELNFNINDYQLIFIEIIPVQNEYGKFINIPKKVEKYFYIYFNDNKKEEIKRTKLHRKDKISKINVVIDYKVKSLYKLFYSCKLIESINFKNFYRNNIIDMNSMFSYCSSLKEINISNFNTKNVTNMNSMFSYCSSLKEINISNFNTNNVEDLSFMFNECSSLTSINLSNFNTDKATNMSFMFKGCSSLREINISNFNTNNVKDMHNMFNGCESLKEINLSNFYTNNVTNMSFMFYGCFSLNNINLSNFNTNNVTDMSGMFYKCSSLKEINLSNFDINKVEDMSFMFYGCSSLIEINISNFNTSKVEDMNNMFSGCIDELKSKIRSRHKNFKENAFYNIF